MNLLKSKLRRLTAVAAGTLIGLSGVAFFASPASAHDSFVKGSAACDTTTGEWVVTWEVNTDNGNEPGAENYRFLKVESFPTPVEGIVHTPDDADPAFPHKSNEPLVGTQRVGGDAKFAKLEVQVKWSDEWIQYDHKKGFVKFHGTCSKEETPKPDAQLASSCEGVTVTLANGKDATADAVFTIKGSKDFEKKVTVKAGDEPVAVEIPAENAEKVLVFEGENRKPILVGKWEQPADCTPAPNFEAGYEVTCDSLIFDIDNSKGKTEVTAVFSPNKGEKQTLVVKAGEKKSVTIKGEKGLVVNATINGEEFEPVKWDDEEKPADCDATPTPTPTESTPGEGGGLPVTGPVAGSIAGGAALLLAAGAVLFMLARRRKVKFTA
ncbi:cell wall anchor protein [Actinoplanes sp. LDG1-06]|uniref:Cell wall anchor protein n=1 Tax=Paractinoplanes ovalisporus TaxID=2810368 RepID=A0ABS2ACN7_9ACTN|nr:cell wall anchor protein [Actinoplanes ovalisporus]MBM2617555.1 cell wall anchor protein [Actinoplanes ovalisporus]